VLVSGWVAACVLFDGVLPEFVDRRDLRGLHGRYLN
jgi:hypothetical protein